MKVGDKLIYILLYLNYYLLFLLLNRDILLHLYSTIFKLLHKNYNYVDVISKFIFYYI